MTGMIWRQEKRAGKRLYVPAVQERSILHVRFLCGTVTCGPKTPEALVRRRVAAVCRTMRKLGVTQVVLPEGFDASLLPEKYGLRPVSTLPLRRRLAAEWVRVELERKGKRAAGGTVAVTAERLSAEVARTVTELCLHHRYVLLETPSGGEALCRQLRRDYGVSLQLHPTEEQLAEADAVVLFCPQPQLPGGNGVVLPLYDESASLPPLCLPLTLEEQLPVGVCREQLLCALQESGAIRPGQITIGRLHSPDPPQAAKV